MKQEGLLHFTDIHLTVLGLVIFFIFFVVMGVRVFRKGSKSHYDKIAKMPLDDEDGEKRDE